MAGWKIEGFWRRLALFLGALGGVTVAAWWLPLPVPYDMDFSMLYGATLGLRHGVGIYDRAGQLALLKAMLGPEALLPYFVYPPWYAWTTAFLGWLPIAVAARMWFFLSAAMIAGGVWWAQPLHRTERERIWRVALSFLWLPVVGALVVGQYAPPLLLGLGLFLRGWRRQRPGETALGLLLLTFKPHLGVFPWLAAVYLFWRERQRPFVRRALRWTLYGLAALVAVSFLVQPNWPLAYWQALGGFQAQETFGLCEYCAGTGMYLARWWTGWPRMDWAARICLGMALLLGAWLARRWRAAARWSAGEWMSFSILAALLLNPYVMNYDYLLLLLPLWLTSWPLWGIGAGLIASWLALPAGRTAVNLVAISLTWVLLFAQMRRPDETH